MAYSKETKEKIDLLLSGNDELRKRILDNDAKAISELVTIYSRGISSGDIVRACESGKIEELYERAKKMEGIRELYKTLCEEYYSEQEEKEKKKGL